MRTSHLLSALTIGASLLAGTAIAAPASAQGAAPVQNAQQRRELSIAQISDKLSAAGYRNITEIEREGNAFEVKAIDKSGARVKLQVDPQTGNVLESRTKERDANRRDHDDKK